MKLRMLSIVVVLTFAGSLDAYATRRRASLKPKPMSASRYRKRVEGAQADYKRFFDIAHDTSRSKSEREEAMGRMQELEKMVPEASQDLQR